MPANNSAATPATHHVLHVTASDPQLKTSPWGSRWEIEELEFTLDCFGCEGWQECGQDHAGFDPEDDESPATGADDFEIHGAIHTWRGDWGWTLPYPGCVLRDEGSLRDAVREIAMAYGSGDYMLEADWDDTEVWISALCMADGSPLVEVTR